MTDLRNTLQASLGSAYSIERELGGGGMSRVFVSDEVRLGRKVVVKVLSPELAQGVSTERFEREIRVAAGLQHPHIVPVLAAGEAGGLPYYTMPFVEGRSLRERLAEGPLSIREVGDVLRAVAEALEYAHAHGVVHRDIKPDNVLLSGRTAVVTDFGIAKALSASRTAAGGMTLTQLGTSIGTPAYMSPEQASGDPATDHRTDFYALGVTAYELLAGTTPFANLPTHKLVWAHMSQEAPSVTILRPDTPPALATLIAKCLAKSPEARPQSAEEIIGVLDTITTGSGTATTAAASRKRIFIRAALVTAAAAAAASIAIALTRHDGPAVNPNVVVIAPFRVSADPSLGYLREGMLDLLAANLTGEGGPRAMDPRAALAAWRREKGDENPSEENALAIAHRAGAGQLILGSVVGTPSNVVISADLIEAGGLRTNARVSGPVDRLSNLIDELTGKLLLRGASTGSMSDVPLPAIRAYLDGQNAYRKGRYAFALTRYQESMRIDSTFVPANLGALAALSWLTEDPRPVYKRLEARRRTLSPRDRVLLDAWSHTSGGPFISNDSLLGHWAAAAAAMPENADVAYEKGDMMFHFGMFMSIPVTRRAAAAEFMRALAIDSSFAPALEHLIDLAVLDKDTALVRRLSAQYLALDSAGDHAIYIRWRAARATGDSVAARQVVAQFDTASAANLRRIVGIAQLDAISIEDAQAAAAALSRASDRIPQEVAAPGLAAFNAGLVSKGRSVFSAPGIPYFVRDLSTLGFADFWDADSVGVAAAYRRAKRSADTASNPIDAYASACGAAMHVIAATKTEEVAAVSVLVDRTSLAANRADGSLPATGGLCATMLSAWNAVQRGDASARQRVEALEERLRVTGGEMGVYEAPIVLGRLWEKLGEPGRALRGIRLVGYHWSNRGFYNSTYDREEGRLAAAAGDREGAIAAYTRYLTLRDKADPSLQPINENVRRELGRLKKESGGR